MGTDVITVEGPQAVRRARTYVLARCEATRLHHLCEVAALLATELVTNAIRHARGRAIVSVTAKAGHLRVAIADDSPETPRVLPRNLLGEGGRGMMLVDTLARTWGVDVGWDGKVVWFEI